MPKNHQDPENITAKPLRVVVIPIVRVIHSLPAFIRHSSDACNCLLKNGNTRKLLKKEKKETQIEAEDSYPGVVLDTGQAPCQSAC